MAPCRNPEKQRCTTLSGRLTIPRCTWWISSCRTGVFKELSVGEQLNAFAYVRICESSQNLLKDITASEETLHVAQRSYMETRSIQLDLCLPRAAPALCSSLQ